jgi:hypothetical protein
MRAVLPFARSNRAQDSGHTGSNADGATKLCLEEGFRTILPPTTCGFTERERNITGGKARHLLDRLRPD